MHFDGDQQSALGGTASHSRCFVRISIYQYVCIVLCARPGFVASGARHMGSWARLQERLGVRLESSREPGAHGQPGLTPRS